MNGLLKHPVIRPVKRRLRQGLDTLVDNYYLFLAKSLKTASNEANAYAYLLRTEEFTPEIVLKGYTMGLFPSSYHGDGKVTWHQPDPRGTFPINYINIPKNLHPLMRKRVFDIRADDCFREVLEGCAEYREKTHINAAHIDVYMQLFEMGVAHSVSVWQDGALVGGTYGLAIGAYFVSESSFFRVKHAGKIAFVRLAEILNASRFMLHDTWWPTEHLHQFGGIAMNDAEFQKLHARAIITPAIFDPLAPQTVTIGETYHFAEKPPQ